MILSAVVCPPKQPLIEEILKKADKIKLMVLRIARFRSSAWDIVWTGSSSWTKFTSLV